MKNIRYIQEVEESKRSGVKIMKKKRYVTPGKKKFIHLCNKFKDHPERFFSQKPSDGYLKTFNIKPVNTHSCGKQYYYLTS